AITRSRARSGRASAPRRSAAIASSRESACSARVCCRNSSLFSEFRRPSDRAAFFVSGPAESERVSQSRAEIRSYSRRRKFIGARSARRCFPRVLPLAPYLRAKPLSSSKQASARRARLSVFAFSGLYQNWRELDLHHAPRTDEAEHRNRDRDDK